MEKDLPKKVGVNGTYMMKFDSKDKLLFSNKIPFEEKLKKDLEIKYSKRNGFAFFNYDIELLIIDYQKRVFSFVGENRYFSNYGGHHADDILIPNFSFDGTLNWVHHIPKKITSKYSSFSYSNISFKDNEISLFFNNNKSKRDNVSSRFYTELISINLKGDVELKESLYNSRKIRMSNYSKNIKPPVHPRFSKKIGNRKYLIFAKGEVKGKMKFQLGTFKY